MEEVEGEDRGRVGAAGEGGVGGARRGWEGSGWGRGGGVLGEKGEDWGSRRAARSEPPRGLSPCDRETDTRLGS